MNYDEICKKIQGCTMTTEPRVKALYNAIKDIVENEVPGDMAECGVWAGGSVMVMAYTLMELGDTSRKLYLYDTFTGMTEPTDVDIATPGSPTPGLKAEIPWKQRQREKYNEWCYSSLADVKRNMESTGYPKENIVYVEGKVEDTLPGVLPEKLSILRLDTDWYSSTMQELVYLYPLLSPKGYLIVDDYGHWDGSRKAVDEYFSDSSKQSFKFEKIDYTAIIGQKP